MLVIHNPDHASHAGRQEMFRGRLVPCHEVPARLDHVLAELQRRRFGRLEAAAPDAGLDALLPRIQSRGAKAVGMVISPKKAGSHVITAAAANSDPNPSVSSRLAPLIPIA